MWEAVLYILAAILEGFGSLYLILSLFRMVPSEYLKEIFIANLLVSINTYFFEGTYLSNLSPLFNLLVLFLLLIVVFRVSLIHSFFVAAIGFVICFMLQGALIELFGFFVGVTLSEIRSNDLMRYILQAMSSIMFLILAKIIYRRGYGFTFIPFDLTLKFKITIKNMVVILVSMLAVLLISMMLELQSMFQGLLLLTISLVSLIIVGIRREAAGGFD